MRRPTVRRQQPGVALFPFLAVLICTMGSLIVLLVLVVQQARAGASQAAQQTPAPGVDVEQLRKLKEQEEDLQWQADLLKDQRDKFAQDLANRRLELAHLEDHIRRLEDDARKLIAQVEALKNAGKTKLADSEFAKDQLADLEREIDEKKKQLDAARKDILKRRPAYAIIPYDGPNGTSRRPMYIECTAEGIVLQPEGIVLSAEDFQGPMGPGNPLDAALRATREHLKRSGLQGEPYPLIVVRPSGAVAFGACRSAMKHWESEFGYELVDQDTELKYPPADPQLVTTLQRAVGDARQRQMALVAAMPNRFVEGRLASFRPEDNISPAMADEELGSGSPGGGSGSSGGRGGNSFGGASSGMAGGSRGGSGTGTIGGGGGAPAPGTIAGSRLGGNQPGNLAPGESLGAKGSATNGGAYAGQPGTGGSSSTATNQQQPFGPSGSAPGAKPGNGASYAGGVAGGNAATGSTTYQGGSGLASSTSGNSGAPGGSSMVGGPTSGSSGSSSTDQMHAGANPSAPSLNFSPQRAKARKAIKNRGENWGLPNSTPKATAVTRPIRMECYADQLVIMPEKGETRAPLVVPIEGDLTQNLDVVIDAVWQRMDRWGLAVLGGYWKPILTIEVKPGGEQRFAELQQLLRGSGIEVERKSP